MQLLQLVSKHEVEKGPCGMASPACRGRESALFLWPDSWETAHTG
jgi:hypothetical protein